MLDVHFLLPVLALLSCGPATPETAPERDRVGTSSPATNDTTLVGRATPPPGFQRVPTAPGTFAHYLRHLPLRPAGTPVLLHNGTPKARQDVHAAVVDISTGTRDLQQCADAVIRLRAEHLFAEGRHDKIAFNFTNGFPASWERWRSGERIRVSGNVCSWTAGHAPDSSHDQFMKYLETVFMYAGTLSLAKELVPAAGLPLEAGDVFIQGGSPGHAVLVLDVAMHADGRRAFLLGQSYMPAQDFHVLHAPGSDTPSPWYVLDAGNALLTPEWTFAWSDRRRWAK